MAARRAICGKLIRGLLILEWESGRDGFERVNGGVISVVGEGRGVFDVLREMW